MELDLRTRYFDARTDFFKTYRQARCYEGLQCFLASHQTKINQFYALPSCLQNPDCNPQYPSDDEGSRLVTQAICRLIELRGVINRAIKKENEEILRSLPKELEEFKWVVLDPENGGPFEKYAYSEKMSGFLKWACGHLDWAKGNSDVIGDFLSKVRRAGADFPEEMRKALLEIIDLDGSIQFEDIDGLSKKIDAFNSGKELYRALKNEPYPLLSALIAAENSKEGCLQKILEKLEGKQFLKACTFSVCKTQSLIASLCSRSINNIVQYIFVKINDPKICKKLIREHRLLPKTLCSSDNEKRMICARILLNSLRDQVEKEKLLKETHSLCKHYSGKKYKDTPLESGIPKETMALLT